MTIAGLRFNNPFNISLPRSGYFGGSVVGLPGQPGYAAFPDMATGYAAGSQRVTDYISGNTSYGTLNTIGTLGPVYATDPGWAAGVSRASGIGVNTILDPNNPAQMQQLQTGILAQELGQGNATQLAQQYSGNVLPLTNGPQVDTSSGFNMGNYDLATVHTTDPSYAPLGADLGTTSTFGNRFDATQPGVMTQDRSLLTDPNLIGQQSNFGDNIPQSDAFSKTDVVYGPNDFTPLDAAANQPLDKAGNVATTTAPRATIQQAVDSGNTSSSSGGQGATGTGMPIQIGPQPGLTQLVTGTADKLQSAFGNMASTILKAAQTAFGTALSAIGLTLLRGVLLLLGVAIVLIALFWLLMPDRTDEILAALATKAA